MKVIHLQGTRCSGKTWVAEQVKDLVNSYWDIKKYYIDHQVIDSKDKIDWAKFREVAPQLTKDFGKFLDHILGLEASGLPNQIILIESSSSQILKIVLWMKDIDTIDIYLTTPTNGTLTERAIKTGASVSDILGFKSFYNKRHADRAGTTLLPEAAVIRIKEIVNGSHSRQGS